MEKICLNVGPSKISSKTKSDINKAVKKGILEISHRSNEFSRISKNAITELRKFYKIPEDYKIFYVSSATMAMHLAITNCVKRRSFHFVLGNFSNQFYKTAISLNKNSIKNEVPLGFKNQIKHNSDAKNSEMNTLTYNETSTGVSYSRYDLVKLNKLYQKPIKVIDITSAAGVIDFDFRLGDIWFFSLQKCFGLPAGLGIMIISQKAYKQSKVLNNQKKNISGLFSFENLDLKMRDIYQTPYTPNVLAIFLLSEKLKRWNRNGGIKVIEKKTKEKYKALESFITKSKKFSFFVPKKEYRSMTTPCIKTSKREIENIFKIALENNFILGKGYGELKEISFRIANFPAVTNEEINDFIKVLSKI